MFLPKAIASLQAQTLANWECIIVDDGSTDNSAEVVKSVALRDSRFRLIQKLNGGSASARDEGLKEAKGEFIQFLDADDRIAPQKLELQVELMEHNSLDICYTAFCFENNQGKRSKIHATPLDLYRIIVHWGLDSSVAIHAFLYRADFIRQQHLWFQSDCRHREDWKWHIGCFAAQHRQQAILDYCGAIYYQNESGKTGTYEKMQKGNFIFMAYMTTQLHGWNKLLWTYRISEEIWIWLLRMIKYRSLAVIKTITPMQAHKGSLLAAILLMPISIISIVLYFIKTYIVK